METHIRIHHIKTTTHPKYGSIIYAICYLENYANTKKSFYEPFTMELPEADPLTVSVLSSFGPNSLPRVREILTKLIRYLHAFCRDVNLTTEEL